MSTLYLKINPDAGGAEFNMQPEPVSVFTEADNVVYASGNTGQQPGRSYTAQVAEFSLPLGRVYSDESDGTNAPPNRQVNLLISTDMPPQALGTPGLQNAFLSAGAKFGEAAILALRDAQFPTVS